MVKNCDRGLFSFNGLAHRLPTICKKSWQRTSNSDSRQKKDVLKNRLFSNYFMLAVFISLIKFSKIVFAVWSFVRSLKFYYKNNVFLRRSNKSLKERESVTVVRARDLYAKQVFYCTNTDWPLSLYLHCYLDGISCSGIKTGKYFQLYLLASWLLSRSSNGCALLEPVTNSFSVNILRKRVDVNQIADKC